MKYLSLFSGIEAATQAWQPLGWECVAVSEIEPFPCAVLEYHYPHVPNLGDVTKITEQQIKDLGKIDLIVFGSPCFVAGTTVISKDGLKPIESIVVGDEVLTHENQFKPVISVGGNKDQDVYEVKASGLLPTIATAEHPYYARETKRVWNNDKRGWDRVYSKPEWVEVKDLKENNLLAIPVLQTSENTLNLTDEECFIIGRYIADGHTAKHHRNSENRPNDRHWQLILSVGSHKVDDLASEIKDTHYGLHAHSDSTHRAVFSSKRLVEIVEAHCGCGAENKHLSTTLLNLPVDKLERVIDGYVSGDGWLRGGTEYRATTISVELVRSLQLAVAKVYHVATMTNFFERPKTTVIDGRTVNQKDTYIVSFRKERPKQAKYFYEDGFVWTRFKSATKLAVKQDVFNLEVADDNSYTANNAVVHNCQDLSVAGGRKGFQGERSSLFYDAIRVIEYAKQHCGARFALLENVPGAFSSNKGADFTEVVKHMAGLNELDTPANGWGKEGAAVGSNGLLEWSVLDAQWFGLAQRRKRVFAIVDFGDWASRPPILLERESLRGDSAPSRETRESVATDVRASTASSINFRAFGARVESELVGTLTATDYKEPHGVMIEPVAYPINTMNCQGRPSDNGRMGLGLGDDGDPCPTLTQNHSHAVAIAGNIIGRTEGNGGNGNGFDESGACCTLTNNDRHAVAYALNNDTTPKFCKELSMTLKVGGQGGSNAIVAYGVTSKGNGDVFEKYELHTTLSTGGGQAGQGYPCARIANVVRRLTPIECEKLQGFPPNFTKIPYRNKPADDCPNGVRYKALGNSMAVNVMAYIGQRIQQAVAVKAYT